MPNRPNGVTFLFPGQGAQFTGMARDLWEHSEAVKALFQTASSATGRDLASLLFEGTEDDLRETSNTQIAVTLANLSASTVLAELGYRADQCAGFSLGELSALCTAGVIEEKDVFAVVQKRGDLMARASERLAGAGEKPGMAAVLGLELAEAAAVLTNLGNDDVYLANHSSPIQIVVAGPANGLRKAEEAFEKAGAMRFIPLKVSGPFHSPLMEEARVEFEEFLSTVTFHDPQKTVIANVTGAPIRSGEEARTLCLKQIVSTVQWVGTEQTLLDAGVDLLLEVGPGTVLTGLWKSFNKEHRCKPAGTLTDIQAL